MQVEQLTLRYVELTLSPSVLVDATSTSPRSYSVQGLSGASYPVTAVRYNQLLPVVDRLRLALAVPLVQGDTVTVSVVQPLRLTDGTVAAPPPASFVARRSKADDVLAHVPSPPYDTLPGSRLHTLLVASGREHDRAAGIRRR